MPDLSKYKNNDRVIFPKGEQRNFLNKALKKSFLTWEQLSKFIGINSRLLRYYRNEDYSLSVKLLKKIIEISDIKYPKNIKIESQYWTNSHNAKLGGLSLIKKYGKIPINEEERKEKWQNWWKSEGRYNNLIIKRKEINNPIESEDLAELCGILIGDGGITQYQISVTLNSDTDKKYSRYVFNLFKKIFKIEPHIYKKKNNLAINVVLSSINAIEFLKKKGIKQGNKLAQNLSVPEWIMKSREFKIACIRGMVDTDGCVVHETHKIKKQTYTYPRLNFTSASSTLIDQSFSILKGLGFSPKIRRKNKRSVQLENLKEICDYFNVVGTSNPKHLSRIKKYLTKPRMGVGVV